MSVTFEVESPDGLVTGADLTFAAGGNMTQRRGIGVPLIDRETGRRGVSMVSPAGTFVQILAQNTGPTGSVLCRIRAADGSVISVNESSGGYAIATCSGNAH